MDADIFFVEKLHRISRLPPINPIKRKTPRHALLTAVVTARGADIRQGLENFGGAAVRDPADFFEVENEAGRGIEHGEVVQVEHVHV